MKHINQKAFTDALEKYAPDTMIKVIDDAFKGGIVIRIKKPNGGLHLEIVFVTEGFRWYHFCYPHLFDFCPTEKMTKFIKFWAKCTIFDESWQFPFYDAIYTPSQQAYENKNVFKDIKNLVPSVGIGINILAYRVSYITYTFYGIKFKIVSGQVEYGIVEIDGFRCRATLYHLNKEGLTEALFPTALVRKLKLAQFTEDYDS
jgi:hypothetical protein